MKNSEKVSLYVNYYYTIVINPEYTLHEYCSKKNIEIKTFFTEVLGSNCVGLITSMFEDKKIKGLSDDEFKKYYSIDDNTFYLLNLMYTEILSV